MSLTTPWQLVGREVILFSGSRSIRSYFKFARDLKERLANVHKDSVVFLQGEAYNGIDRLVRIFAKRNGWNCVGWPADWERHNKAAGHIRNSAMIAHTARLIAYWDGESRGTAHAIKRCDALKIPYEVVEMDAAPEYEDRNIKQMLIRRRHGDRAVSKLQIRNVA